MTKLRHILLATAMVTPVIAMTPAMAADAGDARLSALEQQLHAVQQQLAQMRAEQKATPAAQPVAQTVAKPAARTAAWYAGHGDDRPVLGLGNGRLTVTSRDGAFSFSLRSLVQFDTGYFSQGRGPAGVDLSSGSNFRRAQFGFVGTAWHNWSYNFTYDFGGNGVERNGYIYTASLQYNFAPFAVRMGAFAPFAGLDDSTSSGELLFMEYATAAGIARGIAGAPGREGIQFSAHGKRYLLSVAFTGRKTTQSAHDDQQALVSRASYLAVDGDNLKWLLDANMTRVFRFADNAPGRLATPGVSLNSGPELAVDNTNTIDTGFIGADGMTQWGLETALQSGRLYGQGGYFHFAVDRQGAMPSPDFSGWYAMAAFSLTGEQRGYDAGSASFGGLKPDHPLGPGGMGAWEVATRYSMTDLGWRPLLAPAAGGVPGGAQSVWSVGLNWYPTSGLRFMLDYSRLQVNHIEAPGNDISANAIGLRSQIAL